MHNGNDDDRDSNVQNRADEEAPNNAAIGGDVQGAFQGQDNNVPGEPEEVPIQHRPKINIPQDLNENLDQETALQLEGVADPEDEMPLGRLFGPRIRRTPLPVGPTLVMLGNARRNAVTGPPRYQTVVRNNHIVHSRTGLSNIPHPHSANNGATARTEQPKGSFCGNR
jgi:hypothetical protein